MDYVPNLSLPNFILSTTSYLFLSFHFFLVFACFCSLLRPRDFGCMLYIACPFLPAIALCYFLILIGYLRFNQYISPSYLFVSKHFLPHLLFDVIYVHSSRPRYLHSTPYPILAPIARMMNHTSISLVTSIMES